VVVFVPVGNAPHREVDQDPGAEVRLQMCDYAIAADARFALSRIEVDRDGPSYTAETLRLMAERSPGDELVLVLGADQASALPEWHEPEEVLARAQVAVAAREGLEREAVLRHIGGLAGHEHVVFFDMPRIDLSSSLVRRRAAEGRPIRYLVPDKVANLIGAKSLYGASTPASAT
jgi:nicotinate-nucleotide adenylyltransferase